MSIEAMVQRLDFLAESGHEDRAALARLRRARNPEGHIDAYRYIMNYVDSVGPGLDDYILVASLFGHDPHATNEQFRNIGTVCRELAGKEMNEASERRFLVLLQARRPSLNVGLFRVATMADRAGLPINFVQLFYDLKKWDDPTGSVQKNWAREFYSSMKTDQSEVSDEAITDTKEA